MVDNTQVQADIDASTAVMDSVATQLPIVGAEISKLEGIIASITPGQPVDTSKLAAASASLSTAAAALAAISAADPNNIVTPPAPTA